MNRIIGTAVITALLAAGTTSLVFGQTSGPSASAPASSQKPTSEHHWFSHKSSTERTEAHLSKLKNKLAITDAQQPQWDAYANFMRKNDQERERGRKSHESRSHQSNAIERLEREQAFQAKATTQLNELIAVEKPLYAVLSAEQRKVADKMLNENRREHGHRMALFFGHGHEQSRNG